MRWVEVRRDQIVRAWVDGRAGFASTLSALVQLGYTTKRAHELMGLAV